MKNIKRFISLPIACLAAFSLVACGGEEHTHTYDTTTWKTDATKHWHEATCGCEDVYGDVAGHTDDNHDGVCDECGYTDATHEHTYAEAWSYDENGHWHAATCFHDVKDEVVAHTPDNIGNCTVCGYHVSDPDVSTVKKAINLANEQNSFVKYGELDKDGDITTYEFYDGYTYVSTAWYGKYYYSKDAEGNVIGVNETEDYWGNTIVSVVEAGEENLWGPEIKNLIGSGIYYGALDLVEVLYEDGQTALCQNFVENEIVDGVYSFSFEQFIVQDGFYDISVSFSLNKDFYYLEKVDLVVDWYSDSSVTKGEDGIYTVNEEAMPWSTSVSITQLKEKPVEVIKNPYTSEAITVTDFSFMAYSNEFWDYVEVEEITVELGSETMLKFGALQPETAIWSGEVTFSGEDVSADLTATPAIAIQYTQGDTSFYLTGNKVGTYEVTVTVNGVSKTLKVTVPAVAPTAAYIGTFTQKNIFGSYWDYCMVTSTHTLTVEEAAAGFTLAVGLDKGEGVTVTVDPTVTISEPTKSSNNSMAKFSDDSTKSSITLYTYTLSGLTEGTYTITVKANDDENVTTTMTLIVGDSTTGGGAGSGNVSTPDGTQENPFIITESGDYVANYDGAGWNSFVYYTIEATADCEVVVTPTGSDFFIGYSTVSYDVTDSIMSSGGPSKITQSLTKGGKLLLRIQTYSANAAAEVPFNVAITASSGSVKEPDGTSENPFVITESGSYTANVVEGGYVYYCYVATESGDVVLTFTGNDYYLEYGTFNFNMCTMSTTATTTMSVMKGNTLYIKVSTSQGATAAVPFTVTVPAASTDSGNSGDVATTGTFEYTDQQNSSLNGTYGYTINEDGSVTVTKDGVETDAISFQKDADGYWTFAGTSTGGNYNQLVDAEGNKVTVLSGYCKVMMLGMAFFEFTFAA